MSAKQPELQDYGISAREYEIYTRSKYHPRWWHLCIAYIGLALVLCLVWFAATGDWATPLFIAFLGIVPPFLGLVPAVGVCVGVAVPIKRYKFSRLMKSPVVDQIKLYEEAKQVHWNVRHEIDRKRRRAAERAQRKEWEVRETAELRLRNEERERLRKKAEYWMNLSGGQFEREMATLFMRRGYRVERRGGAGDGGIDILARKDGQTTIIQCKRYKKPAGPAAARELYGSLMASGADRGILACTAGWTKGVEDFRGGT